MAHVSFLVRPPANAKETPYAEATLYVCGRDVDEPAEHCITWDRDRAKWSITGSDPRVLQLPPEQRRVYELLSKTPKSIKDLTEALNPGHVVTDRRSDQKCKNVAKLVYKLGTVSWCFSARSIRGGRQV